MSLYLLGFSTILIIIIMCLIVSTNDSTAKQFWGAKDELKIMVLIQISQHGYVDPNKF